MTPLIITIAVTWGLLGAMWWGWYVDRRVGLHPRPSTARFLEFGWVAFAGGPLIWLLLSGVWWADRRTG